MQVKEIKIENYKGIVDADVAFDDKMNVFVGNNGAGKTTLLQAIDICVIHLLSYFGRTKKLKELSLSDVNYGNKKLRISGAIVGDFFPADSLSVAVFFPQDYSSREEREEQDYLLEGYSNALSGIQAEYNPLYNIPIYKTYSAKRQISFLDRSKQNKEEYKFLSREEKLWNNSNYGRTDFSEFSQWFIAEENNELRQQRDAEDFKLKNPNLEGVRQTINEAFKILSDKDYQIKSSEVKKGIAEDSTVEIVLEDNQTKQRELLGSKSDGEKTIIAFVSDIAYNLTIANKNAKEKNFLEGEGIVLIDEIEAHLHPKWQREIIPLLTKLFPNIQFFITTHSPQVVASVSSESVFICENFKFEKTHTKSKGTDTNTLLKFVFGADERPKKYTELSDKFGDLVDKEASLDALQNIINKVKELEAEDPATDINPLSQELQFRLSAYKFDMEHEID